MENSNDIFDSLDLKAGNIEGPTKDDNPVRNQGISYFNCVYFIAVTISTVSTVRKEKNQKKILFSFQKIAFGNIKVGYGDFCTRTILGKTFMIFFLFCGLVSSD